jgi:hypothetical protein
MKVPPHKTVTVVAHTLEAAIEKMRASVPGGDGAVVLLASRDNEVIA